MPQLQAVRSAVLAPGANYGVDGPLLMYAGLAVRRRGGRFRPFTSARPPTADVGQLRGRVMAQVEAALDELTAAGPPPLVIAKSLGSLSAPVGADRGPAAGLFSPPLTD